MDKQQVRDILGNYIDSIIHDNEEASRADLAACIAAKSKDIVSNILSQDKQATPTIKESILKEFTEDSAIKMKGNSVLVNGKLVGKIQNDLNDPESGINFIDSSGNSSFEFNTIKELYEFLVKRYGAK